MFLEVKNVTLFRDKRTSEFPDAVTSIEVTASGNSEVLLSLNKVTFFTSRNIFDFFFF